jgi:ketosteroid isomerase-like protein
MEPASTVGSELEPASTVGSEFARALVRKDAERMAMLLDPQIEFRAMTPKRTWEADNPGAVVAIYLENWFEEGDVIERLERVEADEFANRERVGYRLGVSNDEGRFVVEQQAYLSTRDGRIAWMRVMCSGYCPAQ